MNEKDPIKRFGIDKLPFLEEVNESTKQIDNYINYSENDEEIEYKFKSYM